MARRSITDEEISLIKGMVARGMKNRDIPFFFNRPDRPVNSGRITGITSGTYGNAASIARAEDEVLNAFLVSRNPSADVPLVATPAEAAAPDPLSEAILRQMFASGDDGVWHLEHDLLKPIRERACPTRA